MSKRAVSVNRRTASISKTKTPFLVGGVVSVALIAGVWASRPASSEPKRDAATLIQNAPVPPAENAKAKLKAWWSERENKPIQWTANFPLPKNFKPMTPKQLGIRPNFAASVEKALQQDKGLSLPYQPRTESIPPQLKWVIDNETISKAFSPLEKIDKPAVNAHVKWVNGGMTVLPEKPGEEVDIDGAIDAIQNALLKGETSVELKRATVEPTVRADQIADIEAPIATFTTRYPAYQSSRNTNIFNAVKAIDGTVLLPGQSFSYNQKLGPRTSARGYRIAPVIIKGKKELGIGGGICQVSSTLFNAVLLADLKITERSNHGLKAAYVGAGRDATVDYGNKDLKFENNTDSPVALSITASGGVLTVRVMGKPTQGKSVKIAVSGGANRRGGSSYSTYRTVYQDGQEIKRERVASSYYPPPPPPDKPKTKVAVKKAVPTPAKPKAAPKTTAEENDAPRATPSEPVERPEPKPAHSKPKPTQQPDDIN